MGDSDCDDGDTCTVDTCDNGLCLSAPQCALCGKTKVDVEIAIDNYGEETTYKIEDASDNTVMQGSGWPSNSVNSFWQCFSPGTYTFTITDSYGDGICCSYGNGGYSVKVNDEELRLEGILIAKKQKHLKWYPILIHLLLLLPHLLHFQLHRQLLGHLQLLPTMVYLHFTRQIVYLQILYPLLTLPMSHQLLSLLHKLVHPRVNIVTSIKIVARKNAI